MINTYFPYNDINTGIIYISDKYNYVNRGRI